VRLARREDAAEATGYRGLLNLHAQPHHTVFLHDFPLPGTDKELLQRELVGIPTRPLFLPMQGGFRTIMRALAAAGIDSNRDYVSLHGLVSSNRNIGILLRMFETLPRRDLARLELPLPAVGFQPSFASYLLRVVARADYSTQERAANAFFRLLTRADPYQVTVRTAAGELEVTDTRGWFDVGGRLRDGENRILPAGEVAYAGDNINGTFVADGAILPSPQHPDLGRQAVSLGRKFGDVPKTPVTFEISSGRVMRVYGEGDAAAAISHLVERDERYRAVTEVGISFNDACTEFVYDWPAASNESRPGVHVAIGGDASPDDPDNSEPLIHLDCMAANVQVFINGRPFMRTSS
jgi:hypothetical protein